MLKKIFLIMVISATAGICASCDGSSKYSFYLTEVSTSGDVGGLTVDYIELYNSTDENIDLTGYYFGDQEDPDHHYAVTSTVSVNEWNATNSEWESDTETTVAVGNAAIIPAGGYLIILFSNDFEIDDAVSKTTLESWIDGETYLVGDAYSGETYLTIPEGLKGSNPDGDEGVYIYKTDGTTKATTFFTYEADEQEDDKVFLYVGSGWSQGNPSPGAANE